MTDLSAQQYRANIQQFLPTIGLKAECYTSIETEAHRKGLFSACIYPMGITSRSEDGYLRVEADSLAGLWDEIQAKWSGHQTRHREQIVRKMALAIIRITSDVGECTDAALRSEFDRAEIKTYGEEACTKANDMAGRGPFAIKAMRGANGAPDLEVANG
jgi:hypothetical protein